jgi:hypothetical protein
MSAIWWRTGFAALVLAGLGALAFTAQAAVALAIALAPLVQLRAEALVESHLPPLAQPRCDFALGFAALRSVVGPATVGDCLEDEHFDPANQQAEQRTTGGLLVWRKTEGVTAFTDGHRTWISGPYGLHQRLNTRRYCWEAGADPARCERAVPSPVRR